MEETVLIVEGNVTVLSPDSRSSPAASFLAEPVFLLSRLHRVRASSWLSTNGLSTHRLSFKRKLKTAPRGGWPGRRIRPTDWADTPPPRSSPPSVGPARLLRGAPPDAVPLLGGPLRVVGSLFVSSGGKVLGVLQGIVGRGPPGPIGLAQRPKVATLFVGHREPPPPQMREFGVNRAPRIRKWNPSAQHLL